MKHIEPSTTAPVEQNKQLSSQLISTVNGPEMLLSLPRELRTKQKLFIYYYLEHRNGVRAARLAGWPKARPQQSRARTNTKATARVATKQRQRTR